MAGEAPSSPSSCPSAFPQGSAVPLGAVNEPLKRAELRAGGSLKPCPCATHLVSKWPGLGINTLIKSPERGGFGGWAQTLRPGEGARRAEAQRSLEAAPKRTHSTATTSGRSGSRTMR